MGRFDCNKIQNILNDSKQKWTCWNNSSNNGTDEWTLSFIKAWGRFDWWLTTHWFSHIWLWICLNWNNLLLSLLPYCWSLHWLKRLVQHAERGTADYSGVNLQCLKGFVHLFFSMFVDYCLLLSLFQLFAGLCLSILPFYFLSAIFCSYQSIQFVYFL